MINFENRHDIHAAAAAAHDAYYRVALAQGDLDAEPWYDLTKAKQNACVAGAAAIIDEGLTNEQSHDAWAKHLLAAGWVRGEKAPGRNTHPGLVPYAELAYDLRKRNEVFCGVVRLVAAALASIPNQ
jgi:hypothetical protein